MKAANPTIPNLPPEEMPGRSFLMPPQEDGIRVRAKILKRIRSTKEELKKNPELIKSQCKVNNNYEEVVACNDIVDHIEEDQTWDGIWKF